MGILSSTAHRADSRFIVEIGDVRRFLTANS
jgi:hypothetical protein